MIDSIEPEQEAILYLRARTKTAACGHAHQAAGAKSGVRTLVRQRRRLRSFRSGLQAVMTGNDDNEDRHRGARPSAGA
jgi:hypothetical protein